MNDHPALADLAAAEDSCDAAARQMGEMFPGTPAAVAVQHLITANDHLRSAVRRLVAARPTGGCMPFCSEGHTYERGCQLWRPTPAPAHDELQAVVRQRIHSRLNDLGMTHQEAAGVLAIVDGEDARAARDVVADARAHRTEGEDCAAETCGGSRLDPCEASYVYGASESVRVERLARWLDRFRAGGNVRSSVWIAQRLVLDSREIPGLRP